MTLEELRVDVTSLYSTIWNAAASLDRHPTVYLHWTAGDYDQTFPAYHLCIQGDGTIVETLPLDAVPSATYMRNTGSIAITLCGCMDATANGDGTFNLGSYPPTDAQIECMAQMVNVICTQLDIPIDLGHVMTHAEAADNLDGLTPCTPYGPENGCDRWDLAVLKVGDEWMSGGNTIRGKAVFYQNQN